MTRDKSMRVVPMVLRQSMMEGFEGGRKQGVWLLLGLLSLGSCFTSALEAWRPSTLVSAFFISRGSID